MTCHVRDRDAGVGASGTASLRMAIVASQGLLNVDQALSLIVLRPSQDKEGRLAGEMEEMAVDLVARSPEEADLVVLGVQLLRIALART